MKPHPETLVTAAFCVAWLASPSPSPAPVRLGPPSATLREPENVVAVVEAREVLADGRARFALVAELRGSATPLIEVRMPPETLERVVSGESYVLGFSALVPVPRRPGVFARDGEGARVLRLADVGDALLENRAPIRFLVQSSGPNDTTDNRDELAAILEQLGAGDPMALRFVLAELRWRDDLLALVGDEEMAVLRRLLAAGGADPMARYSLLEAGRRLSDRFPGEWLAEASRRVLDEAGVDLDPTSYWPALVVSAAQILELSGGGEDSPLLARHLRSNNPGVTRAALAALASLDSAAAQRAAADALASEVLPEESRNILSRFLQGS